MRTTDLLIDRADRRRRPDRRESDTADVLVDALAEAWHVDGLYGPASRAWIELNIQSGRWPDALAAAGSLASLGLTALAETWLRRATVQGCPAGAVDYYRGLAQWRAGNLGGAEASLGRAAHGESATPQWLNAYAAVCWRRGRHEQAREIWRNLAQGEDADGLALVNAATHGCGVAPDEALERAASRNPHERAPQIALARLHRSHGRSEHARQATSRGAMRAKWLGDVEGEPPLRVESGAPQRRVVVRGGLRGSVYDLSVTIEGAEWHSIALNRGWSLQESQRWSSRCVSANEQRALSLSGEVRILTPADPDTFGTHLQLVGVPLGPGTRSDPERGEAEFDACSAWLPIPLPLCETAWEVSLSRAPDTAMWQSPATRRRGPPTFIATTTNHSDHAHIVGGPLRRWYEAGEKVWRARLGTANVRPAIVVVDEPRSSLCYARTGVVRVASGLLARPSQWSQLAHEAAHAWWGNSARFAPGADWFAEALAEYTLHELDELGLCPGYRRTAVATCSAPALAADAARGLVELAERRGRVAAYLVRVKGAFLIAHLKRVIGDSAFNRWCELLHEIGRRHEVRPYDCFALASRIHGASLNWLANQYLFATIRPSVHVDVGAEDGVVTVLHESAWSVGHNVELRLTTGDRAEVLQIRVDAPRTRIPVAATVESSIELDPAGTTWLWAHA